MERQSRETSKGDIGVGLNLYHLSWGKARHGHLVKVVRRAAIGEFAPLVLLEIDSIKSIVHHTLLDMLCILHMHHAY